MDLKQTVMISIFYIKQKKCILLICGMCLMIMFMASMNTFTFGSNTDRDKLVYRIMQELEDLSEKQRLVSQKLDRVVERGYHQSFDNSARRKRDADEHKTPNPKVHHTVTGGAVYVRWGRTSCAGNYTELVYDGIAGGSHYTHVGGATNFLCLPHFPVWGRFTDGASAEAFIFGAEFEGGLDNIMDMSNLESKSILNNQNVPCAVCQSMIRSNVLMVPARNNCFEGWHLEYHGYLLAGHHTHNSGSQYLCVDEAPEAYPAGYKDENGALLYRVGAQCGSLPCPRYVHNRELTCSVCTK